MIMSKSSTPVQIFISIHSVGASPQIGEIILRFCDFFLVSWLYCNFKSNPWMDFHGLWLVRRVFAQGRSFWGLQQYRNSFGGNISRKLLKKGVNGQFQAKRVEYKNHLAKQWCPRDHEVPWGQKIKSLSWDPESWSWSWSKSLGLDLLTLRIELRIFKTFMGLTNSWY